MLCLHLSLLAELLLASLCLCHSRLGEKIMSGKANALGKLDYHLESLAKMSEFLARYENPIDTLLVSEAQKRMEDNIY